MLYGILAADISTSMIVDITCVVILAIFAIVCMVKGFTRQILALLGSIAALVLAIIFCDDLANFANAQFGWTDSLAATYLSKLGTNEALSASVSSENVTAAITALGLPAFLAEFASNALAGMTGSYANVGEFLSNILALFTMVAASFAVIFIVARLVFAILKKVLSKITKLPIINSVDKLLGLVLGIIKGVLVLYILIFIIGLIPGETGLIAEIRVGLNESVVASFLQKYNLFSQLITWLMQNFKL